MPTEVASRPPDPVRRAVARAASTPYTCDPSMKEVRVLACCRGDDPAPVPVTVAEREKGMVDPGVKLPSPDGTVMGRGSAELVEVKLRSWSRNCGVGQESVRGEASTTGP